MQAVVQTPGRTQTQHPLASTSYFYYSPTSYSLKFLSQSTTTCPVFLTCTSSLYTTTHQDVSINDDLAGGKKHSIPFRRQRMQIDDLIPPSSGPTQPVAQPDDPYIADLLQVADDRWDTPCSCLITFKLFILYLFKHINNVQLNSMLVLFTSRCIKGIFAMF